MKLFLLFVLTWAKSFIIITYSKQLINSMRNIPKIKNRMELGETNRRLVLAEILYEGPIARAQIAANVGLTPASVSRITRDLIDVGLVEEGDRFDSDGRVGRKFVGLRVKPNGCYVCGIAINAFRQDIVVADLTNQVIASEQLKFDDLGNANQVIERCARSLDQLIQSTGINRHRLIGCGVALTGAVDPGQNLLRSAQPLNWGDTLVGEIVSRHIECPIFMDNIPNAKNMAVHCFGPTRRSDNILLFNASLAIGSSLMIGGQLYRGSDYQAGLIASMLLPDLTSGTLKPVDQLAGGCALIGEADLALQASRLEQMITASESGNDAASQSFEAAGAALAFAINNSMSLLRPQTVVISGPLLESSHYERGLLQALESMIGKEAIESSILLSPMSSQQAAQSLAIYQSLMQTDLPLIPAIQPIAS